MIEDISIKIGDREWFSLYVDFDPKRKEYSDAFHFDTKEERDNKRKELEGEYSK